MSKMKLKLISAAVFVGSAFGLFAWKLAWATPGSLISTTIISGPTQLPEIDVKSKTNPDVHEVKIKTKGISDVYVVYNTIAPGGHTGWHSHPGPSIVSVKSGTATEYHGEDPNTPIVHAAGTSFVDDGEGAHIVRNEGTTNLELIAFQILPTGATRRIDQPAPE